MVERWKLDADLGTLRAETFSSAYPHLNDFILKHGEKIQSRAGEVREILDFKTQITNPYRRCVGGCERNINVFFLLAEAIWIALGRKDVEFLTIFNSRMSDFSDNGVTFHAPYGYRLRHWGVRTEDNFIGDNLNASKGYDQVIDAIKILTENPESRQVVLSIWNASFDLGYKTKDLPCNDLLMLKIRDGKLITTIANRSNDLHWGLPTNIFQFSFLTELMSASLGIELGTQTHNSQSLHIYGWNDMATKMSQNLAKWKKDEQRRLKNDKVILDFYNDSKAEEIKMDFNFNHEVPVNRFREIEYYLQIIVDNLTNVNKGGEEIADEIQDLADFSMYLHTTYQMLKLYIEYKHKISGVSDVSELDRARFISLVSLVDICECMNERFLRREDKINSERVRFEPTSVEKYSAFWDVYLLAANFFTARIKNDDYFKHNAKYGIGRF